MATIGATAFTLNDWKKRMNMDGTVADIVEVLAQSNEIMDHVLWKEGNLLTGNKVTQRTSIPEPDVRQINKGVGLVKSGTEQITDTVVSFEARSQIDEKLYNLAPDGDALRKSEDVAAIEGFGNKFVDMLIYGDASANRDSFNGLAVRQQTLSIVDPTKKGYTTISAGGSTANQQTSAYFVDWNDTGAYGIFPRNGKAGLEMEDKGLVRITDNNGGIYDAYESKFKWDVGFAVSDPRCIGRLCNVEPSVLVSGTAQQKLAFWANLMKVHDRMRHPERVKLYVSVDLFTSLKVFLSDKNNSYVTYETLADGIKQLFVDGMPVYRIDAIKGTEAVLS